VFVEYSNRADREDGVRTMDYEGLSTNVLRRMLREVENEPEDKNFADSLRREIARREAEE
jgi:hypothetical protein